MARDLRASKKEFNDRCKWYKAKYVMNKKLVKDAICEGVFYSKDVVDQSESKSVQFGVANQKQARLTIETPDYIGDLTIDDYVLYDNNLWRVSEIPSKADDNLNKIYSTRPQTLTRLVIVK